MIGFGASGFGRTPVTKALLAMVILLTFAFGNTKDKTALTISWNRLHQVWRPLASALIFSSIPELIFGVIILYSFRTFERMFGSRKFASAILFFIASTCLMQLIASFCNGGASVASSGPYSIIFGLFVYFFGLIPSVSAIVIGGIPLGEKIIMYLLGAQLAFTSIPSWNSVMASAFGIIAGMLHYPSSLPFHRLRIPKTIASLVDTTFSPLLMTNSTMNSGAHGQRRGFSGGGSPSSQPNIRNISDVPPPSENDVTVLVGMGFSEDTVRRALAEAFNDVERATNILLDGRF